MDNNPHQNELSVKIICHHFTDKQVKEAEEIIDRYLEIVLRIYESVRGDPERYARFRALTASKRNHTISDKGPSSKFDSLNKT